MAKLFLLSAPLCLFLLSLTTIAFIANSARILDEVESQPQAIPTTALPAATTTLPTTLTPAAATPAAPEDGGDDNIPEETPVAAATPVAATPATADAGGEDEDADPPIPESTAVPVAPGAIAPAAAGGVETTEENPGSAIPAVPVETPAAGAAAGAGGNAASSAAAANPISAEPSLSFFMHDIIGGSNPSARVVAGIVANTDVTGLPFSKINNNLFPITGGIPLVNPKLNGIITNNNLPQLVGLNAAQAGTVFRDPATSNTVSGGGNQPFVSAGNLPAGLTIQKLMFGSVTVIDDELTEGHELGSPVIGKAQGMYLASSLDGTSQTIVVTVVLHGGGEGEHHGVDDTISLFGVHRSVSPVGSEVAVVGGTGKYENAKGYAVLETLPNVDQHTTDGVDTIMHFSVYLTYE